ncbi:MAG: hypothetical protein IMZ44_07435 [Planctomycetes bacterium]|nr:hypothetical protein [Planctomycetota bacterium]
MDRTARRMLPVILLLLLPTSAAISREENTMRQPLTVHPTNRRTFADGAGKDGYSTDPPAADGRKVIIADVDHVWPRQFRQWVWKNSRAG